jgi:hypothetical protein
MSPADDLLRINIFQNARRVEHAIAVRNEQRPILRVKQRQQTNPTYAGCMTITSGGKNLVTWMVWIALASAE